MTVEEPVIEVAAGVVNESVADEVYRNLKVLYGTVAGEQALDRDFGIDPAIADYPMQSAQALLATEYVRKTGRYEPRARVLKVDFDGSNSVEGTIKPRVVIELV